VELYFNELSLDGQFKSISHFTESLALVMTMRREAARFSREVKSSRKIGSRKVTADLIFQQVVERMDRTQRDAVKQWLLRLGPFWEDGAQHPDVWLQHKEELVTGTSIAEAAWQIIEGTDARLLSIRPSDWEYSPVSVMYDEDSGQEPLHVTNYLDKPILVRDLELLPLPLKWEGLVELVENRFKHITFAHGWSAPLLPIPFSPSAAERFIVMLNALDEYVSCLDTDGHHNSRGAEIYKMRFEGHWPMFVPESDSNKRSFRRELTFVHPDEPGESIFCHWHGRVATQFLRLHFSWPVNNGKLYVVYAGPKITKG